MDTLQINPADARKAYEAATPSEQALLKNLFGEDTFRKKEPEDIKTFEDACEVLGKDPKDYQYEGEDPHEVVINAMRRLMIIRDALVGDWVPDWCDGGQRKYYPYFYYAPGSGFSYLGCDCDCTLSLVGSRLLFPTAALATYAGKQFIEEYRALLG